MTSQLEQQAQNILLSSSKDVSTIIHLADRLTIEKSYFFAMALFKKAFYLDVSNDQVLAKYISFLVNIGQLREALDFLIHTNFDISESIDRQNWISQLVSQLPNTEDWQRRIKRFANLDHIEAKEFLDLKTYCRLAGIELHTYANVKHFNLPLHNSNLPVYQKKMSGIYTQPEVVYAVVNNVQVCNDSFSIHLPEYVIRSEFGYSNRDTLILNSSEEKKVIYVPSVNAYTNKGLVRKIKENRKISGLSLSLLAPNNTNYYHFFYELFSKVMLLSQLKLDEQVNLILPASLPKRFLEIFEHYKVEHPIIFVENNEVVTLEQALIIDGLGCISCDPDPYINPTLNDNFISDSALSLLKPKSVMAKEEGQMIYIKRKSGSGGRNDVSEEQIAQLASEFNFKVIAPEELSFEQQIELFASASVVMGAMGAAFTNMVFCKQGTKFIAIAPYEGNMLDLTIWSKPAFLLNIELHYFFTNNVGANHVYRTFCDKSVDIDELRLFLTTVLNNK